MYVISYRSGIEYLLYIISYRLNIATDSIITRCAGARGMGAQAGRLRFRSCALLKCVYTRVQIHIYIYIYREREIHLCLCVFVTLCLVS